MIDLYESVKETLEGIEEIEHVDLWANQVYNTENEDPFRYPACFISFNCNDIGQAGEGVQYLNMDITVRLYAEGYSNDFFESLKTINLANKINKALCNLSGEKFKQLQRTNINTDDDITMIYGIEMVFHTEYTDTSAQQEYEFVNVNNLDVK